MLFIDLKGVLLMRFYKDEDSIIKDKYIPKKADVENFVRMYKKAYTNKDVNDEVNKIISKWKSYHY